MRFHLLWLFFFSLIAVGILIGAVSENNYMGDTSYRFSDWLGYGLAHGILGGAQIMMGVVAYVLPIVLITIVNIPHLTASGVVDQTLTQQITAFFKTLAGSAQASIIVCFFGGLIVAWIVSAIRKIFGVQSPVPLTNKPDTPPLES